MGETKIIEISQKLFSLIAGIVVIIAVFMVGELFYKFQSLPQNAPHEISVSGEAKAYAKPDVALISFGVHTQSKKSQDAVLENNKIMNAVINSVKNSGVDDKDIQTTLYNLNSVYDYTESGRVFRGYSLDQQVKVKIKSFDKINEILDKAASNGANMIGDLQFTVDDMEKFRSEARAKAIEQAKEKAFTLMKQSGLKIERLVNISEGYAPIPVPYGGGYAGVALEKSIAPQIETGQLEVNSTVTLTYQVK